MGDGMTREEVYKELEQVDAYFRSSFDAMYGTVACEMFRNWTDAIEQAIALLKEQESRHRLEVHNIGNVDIPDGVSDEQFHAVMNNVVTALEHTDRGESWPYGERRDGDT